MWCAMLSLRSSCPRLHSEWPAVWCAMLSLRSSCPRLHSEWPAVWRRPAPRVRRCARPAVPAAPPPPPPPPPRHPPPRQQRLRPRLRHPAAVAATPAGGGRPDLREHDGAAGPAARGPLHADRQGGRQRRHRAQTQRHLRRRRAAGRPADLRRAVVHRRRHHLLDRGDRPGPAGADAEETGDQTETETVEQHALHRRPAGGTRGAQRQGDSDRKRTVRLGTVTTTVLPLKIHRYKLECI